MMNYTDIQPLLNTYHRKLAATGLNFKRYLYSQINWNARLLGIKGARGVGKTTMLLQRIKETFANVDDAFYVSLDNLWFQNHSVEELVEFLYTHGVTHLFLDEVHKFGNWTTFIKNMYDNYPDLNIVYTGSAMLAIDNSKSDLSRRQSLYTLRGLSFREYLEYESVISLPSLSLEELLATHTHYAMEATARIKVLKYFENYLNGGYYPYYKEAGKDYLMRIGEVVQLVIDSDIPAVEEVMKFIYNNIMYAELNCKSDYCQVCGYDGEIAIKVNDEGKHYLQCPQCGNTDESKMNVARRVCGYISTNGFNEGRLDEIANRVIHLDDKEL